MTISSWPEMAQLDACAQADLVRTGAVSIVDSLLACRERVNLLNPLIHALITVDFERALSTANASKNGRRGGARSGEAQFSGVPYAVKDATAYPGMSWGMGSCLFAKNVAPGHSPFTECLDAAGLLTIAKSATSEFGLLGSTETLAAGVTHNPWNLAYSAGGSSGGAAAAVAAGLLPMAHGNDAGGSLRVPASVCGLFGFKPTNGLTAPSLPVRSDFGDLVVDHCISRSVRDSAGLLALTQLQRPAAEALVDFSRPLTRRLRLGTYSHTLMGRQPADEVQHALDSALKLCSSLGHTVVELEAPKIDGRVLSQAFFTTAGAAICSLLDSMAQVLGRAVALGEVEPFTLELAEHFRSQPRDALARTRVVFADARQRYLEATHTVDVVVTPTLPELPWQLGVLSPVLDRETLMARTEARVAYTPIHNIVGCPAMTTPLGWSRDGLPIGVHFAAAPGADAMLLALAFELEAAQPWADHWPPWSYLKLTKQKP